MPFWKWYILCSFSPSFWNGYALSSLLLSGSGFAESIMLFFSVFSIPFWINTYYLFIHIVFLFTSFFKMYRKQMNSLTTNAKHGKDELFCSFNNALLTNTKWGFSFWKVWRINNFAYTGGSSSFFKTQSTWIITRLAITLLCLHEP